MNRHFWAATKARAMAEIIPVPAPTCQRNRQEVATAKKHGSKGGGVVFGVDTGAKRGEFPEDIRAVNGGGPTGTTAS
jgi:hypothetical protein